MQPLDKPSVNQIKFHERASGGWEVPTQTTEPQLASYSQHPDHLPHPKPGSFCISNSHASSCKLCKKLKHIAGDGSAEEIGEELAAEEAPLGLAPSG